MVTKPPLNRSKTYARAMWLLRLAELNCVTTKIRSRPELMQFEMGTSTRRYLPASGTAGFARSRVSGNSRVPAPPPRMTARTRFIDGVATESERAARPWGRCIEVPLGKLQKHRPVRGVGVASLVIPEGQVAVDQGHARRGH